MTHKKMHSSKSSIFEWFQYSKDCYSDYRCTVKQLPGELKRQPCPLHWHRWRSVHEKRQKPTGAVAVCDLTPCDFRCRCCCDLNLCDVDFRLRWACRRRRCCRVEGCDAQSRQTRSVDSDSHTWLTIASPVNIWNLLFPLSCSDFYCIVLPFPPVAVTWAEDHL